MPLLLLLSALSGAAAAAGLLVPDFTPRAVSDFQLADDMTASTLAALRDRGIAVVDPAGIAAQAQDAGLGCAEEPDCPGSLWAWFDADHALVGTATFMGGEVEATVLIYERASDAPVRTLEERFPAADINVFAGHLAETIAQIVQPAGAEVVVPVRDTQRSTARRSEPSDAPPSDRKAAAADDAEEAADRERQEMGGIPRPAYRRYKDSGMSRDEWLRKARIRANSGIIELHAGAVLGDLDRRYDTRVAVQRETSGALSTLDVYQYETFVNGTGFMVGAAIGFIPLYWCEFSLYGGAQIGTKQLSTGWEQHQDGALADADVQVFDPATATMAVVEPRMRIYVATTGPVKPYLLGAFDMRFFDGFSPPDLTEIDYADRPGGVTLGPTVGGGLAFDTAGRGTGFVEVPWTYVVSPVPTSPEGGSQLDQLPDVYSPLRQYLSIRVGIGTRF